MQNHRTKGYKHLQMILVLVLNRNAQPLPHSLHVHVLLSPTHLLALSYPTIIDTHLLRLLNNSRFNLTLRYIRVPEDDVMFLLID